MMSTATASESEIKRQAAKRSTMVSVWVNLFLTILQIIVGIFAKSQSLVADGIHSLSDLLADFVVLAANRISHRDADDDHPYGHARIETAASLVLGMLLLAVGAGMLWSAGVKITEPESIPDVSPIALWVALFTLVSKEGLFRYMLKIAQRVKSSMLVANAWHARSDAASSLVVAMGIAGNLMGYTFLDPLAAALVGFMVMRMGGKFSWDAICDLIDRGLEEQEVQAIRETLSEIPGVRDVHDMRTRRMGDYALVDVHLLVDGRISVSEGHHIAATARRRVMEQHRTLDVLVHIDPEDDHGHATHTCALPPRDRLMTVLQEMMGQDLSARIQVQLHYLNGSIELEATLDPASARSPEERQLIEQQLVDIIDHVREIRSVRILESRLLVEREDPRDLPPPHA